ncbi:MAG: hypothetical protein L0K10_01905 [Brevibacterium aurantiacum]|nr:hypothetical protein [Brevibacterium aurantiacum]
MTYKEHGVIKPEVILDTGIDILKDRSVASHLVTRDGFEKFDGAAGDTVNVKVPEPLRVREYALRNDRSQPIVTDTAGEISVPLTVEKSRNYSAIKLSDEQRMFDFEGAWGDLQFRQLEAIAGYNQFKIIDQILNAPYEVQRKVDATPTAIKEQATMGRDPIYNAFVDATRDLKRLRAPGAGYMALAGSGAVAEIKKNQKLTSAEGNGPSALAEVMVGKIGGVTVIEDPLIPDDEVHIFVKSAFLFYNAAPALPQSVPFASSAAADGFALSWLMDYDTSFLVDRSVFQTLVGYSYTQDLVEVQDTVGAPHISDQSFFTRGIKLKFQFADSDSVEEWSPGDGNSDTAGGDPESFLALAFNKQKLDAVDATGQAFPGVLGVPGVIDSGS